MDAALSNACNWLAAHPWITTAILVAGCLFVAALDRVPT